MCLREKLESGMAPGKYYTRRQLIAMTGAQDKTLMCALSTLRRRGRLVTERSPLGDYKRWRLLTSLTAQAEPSTAPDRSRPLFPAERVPIKDVRPHPDYVGPLDVWRGKTWQDMPGTEEITKKCNFFLWRRGLLKYDCQSARGNVGVMPTARLAGMAARGFA